jgi:hypothetical protein
LVPVVVSGFIGANETFSINLAITERDIISELEDGHWKPFRTVHPRGIWSGAVPDFSYMNDPQKKAELMIRHDRPTPTFLSGKQAVRTLADLPALPTDPTDGP